MGNKVGLLQKHWSDDENKARRYSLCGTLELNAIVAEDNRILDTLKNLDKDPLANEFICSCADSLYVFGVEGKLICCACHKLVRLESA